MILKRRIIRTLAAIIVTLSILGSNCALVFAQPNNTTAVADTLSDSEMGKNSYYSEYISQFSESDYSSKNIVYDLKGVILDNKSVDFEINVEESGLYGIGMSYKALDTQMSTVRIGIRVDGDFHYSGMQRMEFPRMWTDADKGVKTDDLGNEYASAQVLYTDYYYNEAIDQSVKYGEKFLIFLSVGVHKVSLIPVSGTIEIEYFKFSASSPNEKYSVPEKEDKLYSGDTIVIEGENAEIKSSYFLVDKSDGSSAKVSPQSAEKNLINYVGGGNWKTIGETLVWQTPELEEGYYKIGFSYRQNTNIGSKSYRALKIDGVVPFKEAEKVGFSYTDDWKKQFFTDDNDTPYLVYFSKGSHQISLTVTSGDIALVRKLLTEASAQMSELYIDITKITGETVDVYRDYDLFNQISDMQQRLENIRKLLSNAGIALLEVTGEKTGSNYSVIKNMILTIDQMLDNKFEAHRYKDTYYTNYCSVSSVLQELCSMPLDLDKITLTAADADVPFENVSFFEQAIFSIKRFIVSFFKDYNDVSKSESNNNSITIWVSWGRDQAQVLNSLIERSFTPDSGINVNLKLVSASVIQAILSGNGPDCFLQMARSEPVNLAIRGVMYDLLQFDDCNEVIERFMPTAEVPYRYNGGLYALPNTQDFYVMFYRSDILSEYGLEVPETWEDFNLVAKLLMRNNMSVYMPVSSVTEATGVGSSSIFPSLLLQNGLKLYTDDGKKTTLLSADTMEVFEKWTNYYTKLKFPVSMNFYNRFRTGTSPIGITTYTQYTIFKAAAYEIEDLWGVTSIPGTLGADGTISHISSGTGSGCGILKGAKNPEGAWDFLKWWTSADTQLTYSNDLESVLGPTGRVAVSNIEAMKRLSWDEDTLEALMKAWENVEEIPEYPGSYYVSRSIYQAFWNVVNSNKNTKDMLMKYGKEADDEISRKWEQYTGRY